VVKLKITLEHATKGVEIEVISFLNLDARWGWVVIATPPPLHPLERPGTHYIEGWVGPRAGLIGLRKISLLPPGFDPRTAQPIVSHYTDYAIPAHNKNRRIKFIIWVSGYNIR
jgi:hypothetical protein